MNKVWLLLVLAIVLAAQWTLITSVKTVKTDVNAFGTSAVIVSKAPYMSFRAYIHVIPDFPQNKAVLLVFPDGSQKEVNKTYSFEVFLPRTNKNMGWGAITPGEGVDLTNNHPIDAAVVANVTDKFFTYGIYGSGAQYSDNIDVYWFKVQGQAQIFISGIGVGI